MGTLVDTEGQVLESEEEMAKGLARDHFGWNEEGRQVGEEAETKVDRWVVTVCGSGVLEGIRHRDAR